MPVQRISVNESAGGVEEPDPKAFSSHLLLDQPMVVGLPTGHRLASRKRLRLESLEDETWVLPSPDRFPEFRDEVDGLFAAAGVMPRVAIESTDDVAGAMLVASGLGIGVLPRIVALPLPGVVVLRLQPSATRRLFAVTVVGRARGPVDGFLDELRRAANGFA